MHVRTAAALLGASLTLVAAGASLAARLAASGPIAYSDSNGNLYVASVEATGTKTLFTGSNSETMQSVAISSDGKQVLALDYGTQTRLVIVPAGGGTATPVRGTVGAASGAFSPDGTHVVFSIPDSPGTLDPGIYTVSLAGGTPTKVTASPTNATDALPEYSPDGTKLAFVRDAYDAQAKETVSLEVIPVAGGTPNAITTGLAPGLESGDHLSFSADGKQIAFAGDYSNPGIFTVPVAGGTTTQLTSDYDYWPSFSPDGSKLYFSRDASSANADDNASAPVAPVATDLYELWSVKSDGTGQAVVAEGDFENLVLAAIATSAAASPTTTTPPVPPTTTATTTTPPTGPVTTQKGTPTTAIPAVKTAGKPHAGSARAVSVTSKGPRHLVRWSGKAKAWNVILKIGAKTHTARVKGSVHSHVFVLPGANGAVSARVLMV